MSGIFKKAPRALVAIALMALTAAAFAQGAAQYPGKPIRVILPYAPGGSTTGVTRIYTQKLTEVWGQSVIVDNRPGGNTIIGSEAMVRSPNDGYTLLTVTNTHVINPVLIKSLPYDTLKDFAAISTLTRSDYMLTAHPSFPANNLKEFITYVKANKTKLSMAHAGLGAASQLCGLLLTSSMETEVLTVPYTGTAPAMTALLGSQVDFVLPVEALHFARCDLGDDRIPFLRADKARLDQLIHNLRCQCFGR